MHSAYLAPYYSLMTTQSLGAWLADLANALTKAEANNQGASTVIRNVEQWAENLYRTEKEALLIAIEKRSHFTFDVIHWIAHVTKLLVFLSRAPAANDRVKQELPRHALWLIGVLSWIPNNKDTTAFVETFGVTELLFEVALDTIVQGDDEVSKAAGDILFSWAFKAGHHAVGWSILERSPSALATLALWQDDPAPAERLKEELAKRLNTENAPEQEMRDDAARELRERAASLYKSGFRSAFVSSFHGLCLLMCRNLSARASNEYLFETPHPDGTLELRVYAGGDSIKTFRGNVIKRLAEVFFNLKQQFLQAPKTFRKDEFLAYEQFYLNLKNINYYSHPYVEFVEQLYRDLRSEVDKSAQEKTT
jgi:hypothetical protein